MEYKKEKREVSAESALSKAMFMCSRQEKCCFDIRKKLRDWEISSDDQNQIIQTLIDEKFINEERYTNFYVRDKFRFNRWGRIKISHYLKQKQIPEHIIFDAIEQLDESEYSQNLHDILISKIKTIRDEEPHQLRTKLYRFAQGRGFESQLSLQLIDKLISAIN